MTAPRRAVTLAVIVAALGYFVDIYDLLLFSIVRVRSLQELGLDAAAIQAEGERIIQWQMFGMLLGGVVWGVLGDKRGRLSVLFGSIVLYSTANILNGFVATADQYRWVRFVAGFGLAGELGAGITLVAELMPAKTRGYGTAFVAAVGILGAIFASITGEVVRSWRTAYFIGGGLGFALLLLRVGTLESGLFNQIRESTARRGDLFLLVRSPRRVKRFFAVILIGVPIWYVVSILISFSPELGRAMGMDPVPNPGRAVLWSYLGLAFGDLGSGVVSQVVKSRRKVVGASILLTGAAVAAYFTIGRHSLSAFYACTFALGLTTGYWAVFVTIAAEQFGTNLRATVTTMAPNFVRGAVVGVIFFYKTARPEIGAPASAIALGVATLGIALVSLAALPETYGKDLTFTEE